MFEPLKITAYPRCGIATDEFLPIDGVLFYSAMRREYGHPALLTPGAMNVPAVDLPIQKKGKGQHWFYAASFAQWGPHTDGRTAWIKRFQLQRSDLIDFGRRRGKVIIDQGRYKAYRMPVFYRHALSVSWYVIGNQSEIGELLQPMTHIGKKTSQGFGRIVEWRVETVAYDWSIYAPDGRLMRSIPYSGGILYGIRPPYWLPENQTQVQIPGIVA